MCVVTRQVALLCFMTFVLSSSHNVLDAQTAFVSMALINLMGMPMAILPAAIMFTVQASLYNNNNNSNNNNYYSFALVRARE